jgi:hypothetical protein
MSLTRYGTLGACAADACTAINVKATDIHITADKIFVFIVALLFLKASHVLEDQPHLEKQSLSPPFIPRIFIHSKKRKPILVACPLVLIDHMTSAYTGKDTSVQDSGMLSLTTWPFIKS